MKVLFEVDSTQSELKRELDKNPQLPDFDYVQAEVQIQGRGRQGRSWVSSRGNLLISILLRGPHPQPTWMPHRVAVSLLETLLHFGVARSRVQVKWPNDLMIDRTHKISGILCELVGEHMVVGLGVNLNPVDGVTDRLVTSLVEVLPQTQVTANEFREVLLQKLKSFESIDSLQKKYEEYSLLKIGSQISWQDDRTKTIRTGSYLGLGAHGELRAQTAESSSPISLFSEDIHLVSI